MKKILLVFLSLVGIASAQGSDAELKKNVAFIAQRFGHGKDAAAIRDAITYNQHASLYIFVLEVDKKGVTRRAKDAGRFLPYTKYPHIKEIVDFAVEHGEGFMSYAAGKTPDACAFKKSYVQFVQGDKGKQYIVGQGYCQK